MLKKMLIALVASFAFCSFAMAAVDLNTASQQQLEAIKGIGPQKAKAIIEYRAKNGVFKTTEDIMKVPGIKEGVYSKIKSDITVGGKGASTPAPAAAKASAPKKK